MENNTATALDIAEALAMRLEENFKITPAITLEEAAKELGVSTDTIRKWINSGKLKCIKIDKFYRIKVRDINKLLERNYK